MIFRVFVNCYINYNFECNRRVIADYEFKTLNRNNWVKLKCSKYV